MRFTDALFYDYRPYNNQRVRREYKERGKIPERKSLLVTFLLTAIFGSPGLFYIAPRTATILTFFIEVPLYLTIFLSPFTLLLRPVAITLGIRAADSYNRAILRNHGRYGW